MPVRVENAIYSWWIQPLAVNDDAGRTWIGGTDRDGTIRVARVVRDTGAVRSVEISRTGRVDDHNAPALAFDGGQPHLVVFYTGHNDDGVMRYRAVDRATLAVGPEQRLDFAGTITYAQVLRSGNRLVVLTRVGLVTWRYRISDDFGATWSGERILVDAAGLVQVYVVAKPVTGRPDENLLAFYGHPVSSPYRDLEFARVRLGTGVIETADGKPIGNLTDPDGPRLRPGDLGAAVTPPPGDTVRLLDIATLDGRPAIAFAQWQGDGGAARYRVTMLRDEGWVTPAWSLPSGDPFGHIPAARYLGGAVLGRDDRLYTARRDNDTGTWHVERWSWTPARDTFVLDTELARDEAHPLVRPYVPARRGGADVIVQRLTTYDGYTNHVADTLVL